MSLAQFDISVVVPLYNEEESLPELSQWIDRVMKKEGYSYEAILIDDGSKDNSWKVVQSICTQNPSFKGIKFRRNYGKSAALQKGFELASGKVVITMDADMQDSPDEIPIKNSAPFIISIAAFKSLFPVLSITFFKSCGLACDSS